MKILQKGIRGTLVGILSLAVLTSCSKNLTRENAQSQLEAKHNKDDYYFIPTALKENKPYLIVPTGQVRNYLPMESALAEAGYLKIDVTESGVMGEWRFQKAYVDHIVITPTEKVRPFVGDDSPGSPTRYVSEERFIRLLSAKPTVEILGITEPGEYQGKKICSVDYQVGWKKTLVGEIMNRQYSIDKKQAKFVRYDNGWRLVE